MSRNDGTRSSLRAGVIGLGAMGRHHVRIYREMPKVDLIAVADVDKNAVNRETARYGIRGYSDFRHMLDSEYLDLVSIVVPTKMHHDVSLQAMEKGVNVLVEKPIAGTIADARNMIEAARRLGVRLMVGHIERFNPAVIEMKRRIAQAGTIFEISARRVGPFPDRIRDVGVVVDLASHDIDAMNFLLDSHVETLFAQTAQRIHTSHEDMVHGILRFGNGTIGALDVNWLSPFKVRELNVVGSRGTFVANYLSQALAFHENGAVISEWDDLPGLQKISEGNAIRYAVERREPLEAELSAFVSSILQDTDVPASPESAADALVIALDLVESSRSGRPLRPELFSSQRAS